MTTRTPRTCRKYPWTPGEDALLRRRYPHEPTAVIAEALGRSCSSVSVRALVTLGLHKSQAYLESPASGRLRVGGHPNSVAHRFKPGRAPANKGLRRPGWAPGRMAETQFKPGIRRGAAARNWCPIGTIRTDSEGYQRIKVRETTKGEAHGFGNTGVWPLLSRHLWAHAYGPIPAGHSVVFKDGDRQHCVLENLELVSRADLMRRNTVHNLPKPLAQAVQLLGALNRQLRKRETNGQKQDRRSA